MGNNQIKRCSLNGSYWVSNEIPQYSNRLYPLVHWVRVYGTITWLWNIFPAFAHFLANFTLIELWPNISIEYILKNLNEHQFIRQIESPWEPLFLAKYTALYKTNKTSLKYLFNLLMSCFDDPKNSSNSSAQS